MTELSARRAGRPKVHAEPVLWLGFSAGGVVVSLLLPVLILLFGLALPLGWVDIDYRHLLAVVGNPVTVVLTALALIAMLVHAGHRFRYTLYDGLQLKHRGLIAVICYGLAIIGSIAAVVILIMVAVAS
ncbi:fumarate reductase subunit D [Microlunatus elymi]|uniref:Fumarate reductase subunit D n=1 Tax=Microlunatus elymi TaxID=2596828 RepID=A0A516PYU2_9ACTN|nr:fumarate reductase subunit FrdD [Microlunatus elymi]QDP96340.1 fumarate reductase subunit D [Microlunatus elymi]